MAASYVDSPYVERNALTVYIDIGDFVRRFGADPAFASETETTADGETKSTESPAQMARRYYELAYKIADAQTAKPGAERLAFEDLAVAINKLATVELEIGRPQEASAWMTKGVEVTRALAAKFPDDTDLQVDLCVWNIQAGKLHQQNADLEKATESFRSTLSIAESLVQRQPENEQFQRVLSVALGQLGNLELVSNRFTEALAYYERDLNIAQRLSEAAPDNVSRLHEVAISWKKVADVQRMAENWTESLAASREAFKKIDELLLVEPNDLSLMRISTVINNGIGEVHSRLMQFDEAYASFQRAYDLSRKIADASGQDAGAQRDLAIALDHLGNAQVNLQRSDLALPLYTESYTIRTAVAASDKSLQSQLDLSISLHKLGLWHETSENWTEAISHYRSAIEILTTLEKAGQLLPADKARLTKIAEAIEQCESR